MEIEISGCDLGDARLNRRLGSMLAAIGERPGRSLPTAFQDWANTKATSRLFANEVVSEDKTLQGHFMASALRVQATEGPIRILQDTTEFSFKRSQPEKVGFTKISTGRRLTAVKFWSRDKYRGTAALKRRINPTSVPIEQKESMHWLDNLRRSCAFTGAPERCVHIGDRDRESDIDELYCFAQDLGIGFLVRSCVDRLAEDGDTTIAQVMAAVRASGKHAIRFRDAQEDAEHHAVLSIRHAPMTERPPIGKQKKYSHQRLQIIHADEIDPPGGQSSHLLEADHEPARRDPCRCGKQARAVCKALDHRDVLQDPEERLQDRGCAPFHSRSPGQLHRTLRHRGMEGFVVDDTSAPVPSRVPRRSLHHQRTRPARPEGAIKPAQCAARPRLLHDRHRLSRRLSRSCKRSPAGNNRHLARLYPPC